MCETPHSVSDGNICEGTSHGPRAERRPNSDNQAPENDLLVASVPLNIDLHTGGEGGGDVASPRAVPSKGGSPSGTLDPNMKVLGGEAIPSAGKGPLDDLSLAPAALLTAAAAAVSTRRQAQ